jgi:hypothetical protein
LRRDDATKILREFLTEYADSIRSVSLIPSKNYCSDDYTLQIGATLDKETRQSLRVLLNVHGYVMKESRGFIIIERKHLTDPALLAS